MDACNFLPVIRQGKAESELGDALGFCASNDLEGLDDPWYGLMFEARIFALSVLTDDAQINVIVAGLVAWDILDENNGGVDVQLLPESNVERLMSGTLNRCMQNTCSCPSVTVPSIMSKKASHP